MTEDLTMALAWSIGLIALFTYLTVLAWTSARRKEREAYYKSEAIKKLAEMRGEAPEPVLQMLRETMASWKEQPSPAYMGPYQARAYYRAETIKKIAEMQGAAADAVLTMLREEEQISARRTREGLKLAGFITGAVGAGLAIALRAIVTDLPVYLVGFIPIFVGLALFAGGHLYAPKET